MRGDGEHTPPGVGWGILRGLLWEGGGQPAHMGVNHHIPSSFVANS